MDSSANENAVAYLARLTGLDARHFTFCGREHDRGFGGPALAAACEILDIFGPLGPGKGRLATDRLLHERIRTAYRHKPWMQRYNALNADFLASRRPRHIYAPLSGTEATILGSVTLGRYQLTPCLDGSRLVLLISIGHKPLGLYHPAENLFLVLTNFAVGARGAVRDMLQHFLTRPLLWAEWLRRSVTSGLRRAYVLADNRPSHFVRQSLAYLDSQEEAIVEFARKGGLLVVSPDLCAMDPLALFPALVSLDRLEVAGDRLTETLLEVGLDAHRVYRFNIYHDAAWLRRRLAPTIEAATRERAQEGRSFTVMISLDAERERVVNDVEAFRFVLRKLGEACGPAGFALDVIWDGWTVSGNPGERDREVISRIETMIAQITDGLEAPLGRERRIFDRSSLAKVSELVGCDLAITTQGTGAQVVSWLLQRPTIVYHVAEAATNRSYLDEASVVDMDGRAVSELTANAAGATAHQRFSLAFWGLEDALRRAVGHRLAIRPEYPVPRQSRSMTGPSVRDGSV